MSYYPQSEWQLTEDHAAREEKYVMNGIGFVLKRRETKTKVYERPMTSDSTIGSSAVNPGGLPTSSTTTVGYWHCIDRGFQRQYGDNGPVFYHETWEMVTGWEDAE